MCPHEEQLTAWLLGDLPPEEQQAMTRHLDGCASCRAAKAELSQVLAPLRSGLAKDRRARIEPKAAAQPPPQSLWNAPHPGLRRAALLALSFGSLFALVSAVYQRSQRTATPAGDVTHIEFRKFSDEAPAPALRPLAEAKKEAAATDGLADEARRRADAFAVTSEPVPHPLPPAAEPRMPDLRRLAAAEPAKAAEPPAEAKAAPAAAALSPAQAVAKRARSKADRSGPSRPPADLTAKPVLLAGASLAYTNASPTNAAPTNAVLPAAPRTP